MKLLLPSDRFSHAQSMYCKLCIKLQYVCDSRLYNLRLVIQIVYFSPLNVNFKTDFSTDGCSASVLQHSRWEVSASQPHIHFALHSSCKSKLRNFFFFLSSYLFLYNSFVKPCFFYRQLGRHNQQLHKLREKHNAIPYCMLS